MRTSSAWRSPILKPMSASMRSQSPLSLVLFDPWALITLKETGQCTINLPESFFDMDYPGHYFRRLKTVSLTIPCVTGPYTSVNCTLTLLNSKIRIDICRQQPTGLRQRCALHHQLRRHPVDCDQHSAERQWDVRSELPATNAICHSREQVSSPPGR